MVETYSYYNHPWSKISIKSFFYTKAEIGYFIQIYDQIVPIEVKAGLNKRIKSLQIFLDSHTNSKYGLHFTAENFSISQTICSYPLYAVSKPFCDVSETTLKALKSLVS